MTQGEEPNQNDPARKHQVQPTIPSIKELWLNAEAPDEKNKQTALEAWKQSVSVQMHFNEICMTIRNIAITVLVGAMGLAAYTTKEKIEVNAFGYHIQMGALIALVGLVGWSAFWSMDRHWYHTFLRAAGIHAGSIESRWQLQLPELLLSTQISEISRRYLLKRFRGYLVRDNWNREGIKFDSGRRLDTFYAVGAAILLLTAWVIAFGKIETVPQPKPASSSAPSATGEPPAATTSVPATATPPQSKEPALLAPTPTPRKSVEKKSKAKTTPTNSSAKNPK